MTKPKLTKQKRFELDEAIQLIDHIVVLKRHPDKRDPRSFGVVAGVLTLNEEIEVVLKFMDRVTQATKREFLHQVELIETFGSSLDDENDVDSESN